MNFFLKGMFLVLGVTILGGICVVAQREGNGQFGPEQSGRLPYVTIFEHYFNGRHWNITVAGTCRCQNFPASASNMITSLHTNGNCVVLFRDKGCYGHAVRQEDYSYGYRDLGNVGINDAANAVQRCGCYEEDAGGAGTTPSSIY